MRVERREIDPAAIAVASDDFEDRIQGFCHSMSKAGAIGTYEWWRISGEYCDHVAALSTTPAELDNPAVAAIVQDAAEAAAAGVQCAAYFGNTSFMVFLNTANFGRDYPRDDADDTDPISANQWLDAMSLAILAGKTEWHGEAFRFAADNLDGGKAGQPSVELVTGFMAYVIGELGGDQEEFPPPKADVVAAIDAALSRVEIGERYFDQAHHTALRTLRAIAAGEQETFTAELAELLIQYRAVPDPFGKTRSLLPLVPLGLAALAHRREGWEITVESDYLPGALIAE